MLRSLRLPTTSSVTHPSNAAIHSKILIGTRISERLSPPGEFVLDSRTITAQEHTDFLAIITCAYWGLCYGRANFADDDLDQLVSYGKRAWLALPADHPVKPEVGAYLALGRQSQLVRSPASVDVACLTEVLDLFATVEPLLSDLPELAVLIRAHLSHFYIARAQETGSQADMTAALPWALRTLREVTPGHPQFAELIPIMALDISTLTNTGLVIEDAPAAIDLLEAAIQSGPLNTPGQLIGFRIAIGIAYIQRTDITQSAGDLNAGISHLTTAFKMAEDGDPDRIAIAWNLGSALLLRCQMTGDLQDRDAARFYLDVLGDASIPSDSRQYAHVQDFDIMRPYVYGMLRLAEGLGGDLEALGDSVRYLSLALARLPEGHLLEGRIRSEARAISPGESRLSGLRSGN